MTFRGKFPVPPDLTAALEFQRMDAAAQLRVALPGEIISYDAEKSTCQVRVCYNRVYNDGSVKVINAPLVDVPVVTMQGGGLHLRLPIQPGDECLVIFSDINIDAWHANGGPQTPLDRRRHDIADGFAIIGPNSLVRPIASALEASEGGIAGESAKVAVDRLTQLITIANDSDSLKTIIDDIITQVMAVNTGIAAESGTIPTAASAATAANVQLALILTRLSQLLY